MPVYRLPREPVFPSPERAEASGLLAMGGDLSVQRLLSAYSIGVFPWYSEEEPVLWWSPDPRLILEPAELKVSKSLKRVIKKGAFTVTMDRAFEQVIRKCAMAKRKRQEGTWIGGDMMRAYTKLHRAGYAHSVEAWHKEKLAGGLYGVCLGRAFFGESMFSEMADASKVALVYLVSALKARGIDLIDCQVTTGHLVSMGAKEIPRADFLRRLKKAVKGKGSPAPWALPDNLEVPAG